MQHTLTALAKVSSLLFLLIVSACTTAPTMNSDNTPLTNLTIIQGEYNKFNQKVTLTLPENTILSGTIRKVPPMLIPEMEQVLLYSFVSNRGKNTEGELLLTTADIKPGSRGELRLSDSRRFIVDFKNIYSR